MKEIKELSAHFKSKQATQLLPNYYESWCTPLKHNWKTHYLKLEDGFRIWYFRYIPGDFLEFRGETDDEWLRLERAEEFKAVKEMLSHSDVLKSFVRKEEVDFHV